MPESGRRLYRHSGILKGGSLESVVSTNGMCSSRKGDSGSRYGCSEGFRLRGFIFSAIAEACRTLESDAEAMFDRETAANFCEVRSMYLEEEARIPQRYARCLFRRIRMPNCFPFGVYIRLRWDGTGVRYA